MGEERLRDEPLRTFAWEARQDSISQGMKYNSIKDEKARFTSYHGDRVKYIKAKCFVIPVIADNANKDFDPPAKLS